MEEKPDMKKIALGLIIGTVLISVVVYVGYAYSQKANGGNKVTLPAGQNYLGESAPDFSNLETPPTAPQRFTTTNDVTWKVYKGKKYPYSFNFPETLTLGVFPNDASDAVAVIWGNIPAQSNIILNVENISERQPQYVGNIEGYTRNWWKSFSGLKGVKSVEKFTNTNGMVGYKAYYINSGDQTPNVDIFFAAPQNPNIAIRMANGILDPEIFNRIVDSLKYTSPTLTPTPSKP